MKLNLSCIYTGKKCKIHVSQDLQVQVEGSMSKSDNIGLVKLLMATCQKNSKVKVFTQKFDEMVESVKLIEKLKDYMVSTRLANLGMRTRHSRDFSDKAKYEIRGFVDKIFYDERYDSKLPLEQKLVIHDLTDKVIFSDISTDDLNSLYLPVSKNRTKVEQRYNELKAFPFDKYVDDAEKILGKIDAAFETVVSQMDAYEAMVNEAGNDLVNWGQHKITRYLNQREKDFPRYQVERWVRDEQEKLLKKGIEIEVKEKKVSSGVKLAEKFENGELLTQDELLTIIKQTKLEREVLPHLSYESLKIVLTSNLKCIKDKVAYSPERMNDFGRKVLDIACNLLINEDASLSEINFITEMYSSYREIPSWGFINKYYKEIPLNLIENWLERSSDCGEHGLSLDLLNHHFKTHIENRNFKLLLNMNYEVTKHIIATQLTREEKLNLIPILGGKFHVKRNDNIIDYMIEEWWGQNLSEITFRTRDFYELYKEFSWDEIKAKVLKHKSLNGSSVKFSIENNDKESAKFLLKEKHINTDQEKLLFNILSQKESLRLIIESDKNFSDVIDEVLTVESLKSLFKNTLVTSGGRHHYIIDIMKEMTTKEDVEELNNFIQSKFTRSFEINSTSNKFLTKATKLHLIKNGTVLSASKTSHYSSRNEDGISYDLQEFFKGVSRKELLKIVPNLEEYTYREYITKILTQEEIDRIADKSAAFTRLFVDIISYEALKKYEDKKLFDELVGDRRQTFNRYLARDLEKRLNEKLQKKINPANSIKYTFAS